MAFVTAIPLLSGVASSTTVANTTSRRPSVMTAGAAPGMASIPQNTTKTQVYGPAEDICTFGDECNLTAECVSSSPALQKVASKYVYPMREGNTQVFFDNSIHQDVTLLIVFATDHHGLVLDVVSVLKALSVRVHRTASAESDAIRVILSRIEGELISVRDLGISVDKCVAFWISDEESGDKIFDEGQRLDQITQCIKLELSMPNPRPRPSDETHWHRVAVQKNRANRYTVFSVQTPDRPGLLAKLSSALDEIEIDVASASIKTCASRVENHFFVTKRGFKKPLAQPDIDKALLCVLDSLQTVGDPLPNEALWYQTRDGTALVVAEAIFVDEVNNHELACFKFSQFETPNFRGRLPDAPYRPVRDA